MRKMILPLYNLAAPGARQFGSAQVEVLFPTTAIEANEYAPPPWRDRIRMAYRTLTSNTPTFRAEISVVMTRDDAIHLNDELIKSLYWNEDGTYRGDASSPRAIFNKAGME